jgi:serine/threonine protein kinase
MLCQRCGTEVARAASFCSSCGQDLAVTTPMAAIDEPKRTELLVVREALKNEYDVKEQIGRGGMGIVYRAEERGLKREVALKILPFAHVHDEGLVQRFVNEARTAAQLEHPNVIPIYRVGRAGDVIYLTMRYLRGPSLAELINGMGALDPSEIRRILVESAQALGYAHAHGVVHRDVKPDNIMFKDSGDVVVCDFGIARAASGGGLTGTGTAIGTPYYMSPEQFRAQPLDGRSDIYSLGVVAYQCLTKRIPFDGEDSFAIGYRHVTEELQAPDLRTPEHRSLFTIVRKMMAKEPGHRFQNADELISALTDGAPTSFATTVETPSVSRFTRVTNPAGRTTGPTTPTTPMPKASTQTLGGMRRRPRRRRAAFVGAFALVTLSGLGGSGYYYLESTGGVRPFVESFPESLGERLPPSVTERFPLLASWLRVPETSTPRAAEARRDSLSAALTAPALTVSVDSVSPDSGAAPNASDSAAVLAMTDSALPQPDSAPSLRGDSVVADATPAPPSVGHLIVANAGRNASLWIDDEQVRGLAHDLSAGEHQIRVRAPGFEPYAATVSVLASDTVRHVVRLISMSQCEEFDEQTYNRNGECFDSRARPRRDMSPFVRLDTTVPRTPTLPAVLAVRVAPDGTPRAIVVTSPSDVPEFTLLAIKTAKNMVYEPAVRRGRRVLAWTRVELHPER